MSNKTSDKNVEIVKELIQEYKTYNDLDGIQDLSIYVNALENLLSEREQDKKRIKELEEENLIQRKQIMNIFDNDYIPTQVVIDKIEELKKLKTALPVEHLKEAQIKILQELLGGER